MNRNLLNLFKALPNLLIYIRDAVIEGMLERQQHHTKHTPFNVTMEVNWLSSPECAWR